jgi:gamma-D-glutamyl-L-lysine dipeptidyl-peptidase
MKSIKSKTSIFLIASFLCLGFGYFVKNNIIDSQQKHAAPVASNVNQVKPSQKPAIETSEMYISDAVANVYKENSNRSEKVTQAIYGELVKVLAQADEWVQIELPEQMDYKGWVTKKNITQKNNIQEFNRKIIHTKLAAVFTDSNQKSSVIAQLPLGSTVEVGVNQPLVNNMYLIRLSNGVSGFISQGELSDINNIPQAKVSKDAILNTAKQLIGLPYVWGGTTTPGVDCSGMIHTAFKVNGIKIHRDADQQFFHDGIPIQKNSLQSGDLVFFETYAPGPSHVGIYADHGIFLHASSSSGVSYASLNSGYFSERFIGAKRILH